MPGLRHYGSVGAWFFREDTTEWIYRHVETLEILGARSAARRMTIDITLPEDPASWIAMEGADVLYCVPVARLGKEHPTSFVDLRDEKGHVLPLLTRAENATISRRALTVAIQALLGRKAKIDATLGYGLDLLVEEEGIPAELAVAIFQRAAAVHKQLREGPIGRRLVQVIEQLQANSIIWVPLRGRPGQRRVVKLAYRIPLKVPIVPVRHTSQIEIEHLKISIPEEGPINFPESVRNLASRAAAAMGFDAIKITVHDPVIQDPRSYHFQVRTPAGVRLEEIAPTTFPQGEGAELYVVSHHLYLRGADTGQSLPLQLRFRVHRRGLLNLSLLATSVITSLLWLLKSNEVAIRGSTHVTRAQIAAAVLILVPAGLAVFANRPAENPLATVLLAGVRWFVVLAALCGAAAAAALGGVRPFASLGTSLLVYALISSTCSAAIIIAWTGSVTLFRERIVGVRRLVWGDCRYRSHRILLAGLCVGLNGFAALVLHNDWFSSFEHGARSMTIVTIIAGLTTVLVYLGRWAPQRREASWDSAPVSAAAEGDAPGDVATSKVTDGGEDLASRRDSDQTSVLGEPGDAHAEVPYVPLGMYLAIVLCLGSGMANILLLANGKQDSLGIVALTCLAAMGLFVAAAAINVLQPLAEPPDLTYDWNPWDAAGEMLENLDLIESQAPGKTGMK